MKKVFFRGMVCAGCLMLAVSLAGADMGHKKARKKEVEKTAKAIVKGTQDGSAIVGRVDFIQKNEGVKVVAHLLNVPPGRHGFHVHENGSCAEAGQAAGGHFNPNNVAHGNLHEDGFKKAHAGDLGNITIDTDGSGYYTEFLKGLSLSEGKHNITGKAVILHEKADDFGQPTGNAGGRIGCGIIEITK